MEVKERRHPEASSVRYRKRNRGLEHGGHLPVSFVTPFPCFFGWISCCDLLFLICFFFFSMDKINSKARLCIASDPGDEI